MKLSIIIPYYNCGKWIGRCISSLLNQDMEKDEYEIIIIDDGSQEPITELASFITNSNNIKYIKQDNKRQAAARNRGLSYATGDYVLFCDSDDFVENNVLGKLSDIAKDNELDLLFYNVVEISTDSQTPTEKCRDFNILSEVTTGSSFYSNLPFRLKKGPWSCLINRHFIEKNQIQFPLNIIIREDSWFLINSILLAKRVSWTNVDTYYYVHNHQGLCNSIGKQADAKLFCDSFLKYLEYLSDIKTNKSITDQMAIQIKKDIDIVAFDLLHNAILHCTFANNLKYVSELKKKYVYPIRKKTGWNNKMLLALMNRTYLWIIICMISSILPFKIRNSVNNSIIRN